MDKDIYDYLRGRLAQNAAESERQLREVREHRERLAAQHDRPEQIEAQMLRDAKALGLSLSAYAKTDAGRVAYARLAAAQLGPAAVVAFDDAQHRARQQAAPASELEAKLDRARRELDAGIDRHRINHGLTRSAASVAFTHTDEGRQLYARVSELEALVHAAGGDVATTSGERPTAAED